MYNYELAKVFMVCCVHWHWSLYVTALNLAVSHSASRGQPSTLYIIQNNVPKDKEP